MSHFKVICQYGFIHRQCRCPGGTVSIEACDKNDEHRKILRTAYEWSAIHRVQIMDPDGWRFEDGVGLDNLITFDEFRGRLFSSTIMTLDSRVFDW